MKPPNLNAAYTFRLFIAFLALLLLGASTYFSPEFIPHGFILVLVIALQVNFPLTLLGTEFTLIQVIALAGGLFYGPVIAGWAVILGLLVGWAVRRFRSRVDHNLLTAHALSTSDLLFGIGLQVLPLILVLALPIWSPDAIDSETGWTWLNALAPVFMYTALRITLEMVDFTLRHQMAKSSGHDLFLLALFEIIPLPFILVAVPSYAQVGFGALFSIGGLATVIQVLIYAFTSAKGNLERRLQELSTLNQVSHVLRHTLDLENLLTVIQVQVSQLLKIDNFYIALYDQNEKRIWYPLAVKHGRSHRWPPRPLMPDRLTDRVIYDGNPILLAPRQDELNRVGLPSSEENPLAWMGVPLITSNRTTGCLAVFATTPETEFTQADLNLLTILSGQVSVAIENALLYSRAQHRAAQLETLNRINRLITASLDQQEVFAQVCRSVVQVGGGQSSAVFILDPDKGQVDLAYAHGLSDTFSQHNQAFSVVDKERMRCLRSGQPFLMPALDGSLMKAGYIHSLREEGVQAYGEFPLITRNGQIGFLAVYFDAPHTFRSEEVELLQTFASQAALAVSNARLFAHVDMALSRRANQLSILESISRELAAAINSERLFDMILDYALSFTNSTWGDLSLYNPQNRMLAVKASRGFIAPRTEFSIREGLSGRAVTSQQAINVKDLVSEPDNMDLTGGQAASGLYIPLIHEGRVLGVLCLESERPDAYTDNDQAFVSQLATQAAVAVVNAELYSETQRRLREQSILYLVSTRLVENPNLENVLKILARAMEAALQTSSVGIYFWDENEARYEIEYGKQAPSRPDCNLPPSILYADLETIHPHLVKTGPLRINPKKGRELLGDCSNCQALVFPIIAHKHRLGMVVMHVPKSQVVRDEDLQLLRAIVSQTSVSLHNALLFADVTHGRDRMAAILNSVREGIILIEPDGRIMLTNEFVKTITGLTGEELLNRNLARLPETALSALGYSQAEASTIVQELQKGSFLEGKAFHSPKITFTTQANNSEFVLERSTSPVWGQGKQVIGWMIVLRDVTEEHELAQARELITGTLIHDLRSPVSTVINAIDIARDVLPKTLKEEVVWQVLQVGRNSANRVLGLIESLLDIAKMQSGKMDLNLSPTSLHRLVESVIAEFSNQIKEFSVVLRNEVPEDLPEAVVDQSKLTRVVTNLLDNAIKFSPEGGTVVVSAELQPQGMVRLQVSDTGTGIPEEYREKIFERFIQVPGQRARQRGSGLGLTFCRMAVEAHGGRIWVEGRQPPETGSIFLLTLPL